MDRDERNRQLCRAYSDGEPMTAIHRRTGLSCTQLSRIFREAGVQRKKYELDKAYFEVNAGLTKREISERTGISLKRVTHLWRVAFGRKQTKGRTDFTGEVPAVDPTLLNDPVWLRQKYVEEGLGTPTIARLLATRTNAVIKAFREHQIPLRTIGGAAKLQQKRPDLAWLTEHYLKQKWSISHCAQEFGTSFDAIFEALRGCKLPIRTASEQHEGELNEFHGQSHDEQTTEFCRVVGTQGREWWLTGDVEEKVRQATEHAKLIWADPARREECSRRTAELCRRGGCNSKQILYVRGRDGRPFVFRSTWERDVAVFLDGCQLVADWDFEALSVPYADGGILRNFVVDFEVHWTDGLTTYVEAKNDHLLAKEKEQAKLQAALAFLRKNRSNLIVISNADIPPLRRAEKVDVTWILDNRYSVGRTYLQAGTMAQEVLRHELVSRLLGWRPLCYTTEELQQDLLRMRSEDVSAYERDGRLRSTVPSSLGMPGRKLLLHYQPHFLDVSSNGRQPLSAGFQDPWVLYRCLLQSMEERETLTLERLLREMFFHFPDYARTSHFAPGLARAVIRRLGMSGKRIWDPCCGWGGRLLGSWLEGCSYSGCELSQPTVQGLQKIADHVGIPFDVRMESCLSTTWPAAELVFTSPPFFDVEHYLGDDQPWRTCKTRRDWKHGFVWSFVEKMREHVGRYGSICALYLDAETRDDFTSFYPMESIPVDNRRHGRQKGGEEYLCLRVGI